MDYKSLFQPQSEIKISVLKIENKKLTKSLLDQIDYGWPFDAEFNFTGEKIFGYVKVKKVNAPSFHHIVVAQSNGKLISFNVEKLRVFSLTRPETALEPLYTKYNSTLMSLFGENFRPFPYSEDSDSLKVSELDQDQQQKILNLANKVSELLKELSNHHIFM